MAKKEKKSFVHIYIPPELRTRLDRVRKEMSDRALGTTIALSEVSKRALELGLDVMEKEFSEK